MRDLLDAAKARAGGYRKVLQTLGWALGYKAVALTVSASVAAPTGLTIPPGLAAILIARP